MYIRHVRNMKVSEFFLKSNKQDVRLKKKGLIMKNVKSQPEKTERLISKHIKFSILPKFSKLTL